MGPGFYAGVIPTRDGVGPSCVGLPGGSWLRVIDFFLERFPKVDREVWLQRMAGIYPHLVWLNPTHPSGWEYSGSTDLIQQIIGHHRMFPLTVKGVEEATKELGR